MSEIRKIGEDTFAIEPLNAIPAFLLQPRIAPAFAEVIGAVAGVITNSVDGELGVSLAPDDLEGFAKAVSRFCQALPPKELESIVRTLLYGSRMNGILLFTDKGDPIETMLRQKTMVIWRLLAFAIEVNYPDFFAPLGGLLKKLQAVSRSETSSTSPTSGPATDSSTPAG